jgi:ATP-dependent Clp protease ATP-binding subunit ClpE
MFRKCTKCQTNDATTIIHKNVNGNMSFEMLCTSCAKTNKAGNDEFAVDMSQIMNQFGPMLKNLQKDMEQNFGQSFSSSFGQMGTRTKEAPPEKEKGKKKKVDLGVLEKYAIDMSLRAENGEIDPVIGRNTEVARTIQILNRRTKNNPVLIGEPGVGKTAIVEGIALRILEGNVPDKLKEKRIITLDVASITSGTMFRGMFERNMQEILEALEERDDLIVFIDELHTIMGAGSTMESDMDVANMLKPHLARGVIKIIGATTLEEYRKIEKDSALERRFQSVKVDEPNLEDAIEILRGIKGKYEQYHGVTFSDEAVRACVILSDRYVTDRYMPDKAIDLLDEVGSRINLQRGAPATVTASAVEALRDKEEQASFERDYEQALKYRVERESLEKVVEEQKTRATHAVTVEEIQLILEQMTGIPVQALSKDEKASLSELEPRLRSKVIGQSEAVSEVVRAVKRNRMSLKKKKKPVSLLFAGPTGVGKTELTKVLAKELFGSADNIIRLDMSEYREGHSLSKLIGSPPGYVGHDKAGGLTEKVRRKPYSIILLDEVEKAHPEVMQTFLQVFDDGRLTDSHGKTVDFTHTVIVMTSNLGATSPKKTGFSQKDDSDTYLEAIYAHFAPEFINRLDAIIPFSKLSQGEIVKIVDLMLTELSEGLNEKGITLSVSDEAKGYLAEKGYSERFGARPLARTIAKYVEDKIADLMLEREVIETLHVTLLDGEIVVK